MNLLQFIAINNYIRQNPHHPDLHNALGSSCVKAKRYMGIFDRADAILQRGIEKNPKYAKAHSLLAKVYENQGLKEKAIEELKKCVDYNPPEWLKQKAKETLSKLRLQEY
ncbi:MAG: tetratricopeptide repeat protein [Pseudomonadota bacterium]